MYLEWLHKDKFDFIVKTDIYPNKVVIREDINTFLEKEILAYDKYISLEARNNKKIFGLEIEVVEFAEKEFTFLRV